MKVYFDNAATTPLHPKVFEKMIPFLTENFGNASSIHSFGRTVRVAIEEARETIAGFINSDPSEIYFTSGGTEANNFVINGIVKTELNESKRNKIATSTVEHHSVLDNFIELNKTGFDVNWIEVGKNTLVNQNKISQKINEQYSFLSLIHVNNETGSVNPISEISRLIQEKNVYFHTDAVQSFGKFPIDVKQLGVDSLCASAHKINGPKGSGFAYVKSGTPLSPLLIGGSQERNRRGGTENVAGIIGLAEAVRIRKENMVQNYDHVNQLRNKFIEEIKSIDSKNIYINGGELVSPYVLSITFNSEFYKNDSEAMIIFLDLNGVAVSNGSACTSGVVKASHVILESGYNENDAIGTLRFSFGWQNTIDEVNYALDILYNLAKQFRK